MAMSFSIQRPETPFSQRYSELDKLICLQFASLIQVLQKKGKIASSVDHEAMASVIFNHLNMMFVEFVKSDSMTVKELKTTVRGQVTPLARLICTG